MSGRCEHHCASEDTGDVTLVVKNTFLSYEELQTLRRSQSWSVSSSSRSHTSSSSRRERLAATLQQPPVEGAGEHVVFSDASSSSSNHRCQNDAAAMVGPAGSSMAEPDASTEKYDDDDEELLEFMRESGDAQTWTQPFEELTTLTLHELGRCQPCFFFVRGACESDQNCAFCHLSHTKTSQLGRRPRPSKAVRQQCRDMKRMLEENCMDPQAREQITSELAKTNKYFARLTRWNDSDTTSPASAAALQGVPLQGVPSGGVAHAAKEAKRASRSSKMSL